MIDSVSNEGGAGGEDLRRGRITARRESRPTSVDRLPPHSMEAEVGVLSCILISPNDCMGECIESLKVGAEVFYDLRHQTIYATLAAMFEERSAIDVITLMQRLKDKQLLEQVGGMSYLSPLPDAVPSSANLSYYLEIVKEKFVLRKMIATCTDAVSRVYDYEGEVEQLLDEVERDILKIRPNQAAAGKGIKDLTVAATVKMEQMFTSQGAITGLSTGFVDLDRQTDGLHAGEMIVVAAYPSAGKTALALNIAVTAAKAGVPALVCSCEMMPTALVVRAVCAEARVNLLDLRDGVANEGDFSRMTTAARTIAKLPLVVENCNGMTIGELVALARRMQQQHRIGLMVVDYLQLLSCPGADSREQEVSKISKGIKSIAMQLGIPVLALSQLNDDGKLRESRAIGQDADSIWHLDLDGERVPKDQPVKLRIEKNREGPAPALVDLLFKKQFTRFEATARVVDGEDVPGGR
jgi:replicative DNA helicase